MRRIVVFVTLVLAMSAVGLRAEAVFMLDHCPYTATSSVRLSQDIDCGMGDGITIQKSGITIDLNGHAIRGQEASGTKGIDDSGGFSNLTIKNGAIRGFETGVLLHNAKRIRVKHITAANNVNGFEGSSSHSEPSGSIGTISSSDFSGNGRDGIELFAPIHIKSTDASNNGTDGIAVYDDSTVEGGHADGNGRDGVVVESTGSRVTGTEVDGNGFGDACACGDGLQSQDAGTVVDKVHASGNLQDGIEMYHQPGETGPTGIVKNSKAYGNGRRGIYIYGDDGTIKSSIASSNHAAGIYTSGENERINKNHADGNGYDGGSDGIGLGIETVNHPTTTPTGHNEASGNDAPQECNPTTLC